MIVNFRKMMLQSRNLKLFEFHIFTDEVFGLFLHIKKFLLFLVLVILNLFLLCDLIFFGNYFVCLSIKFISKKIGCCSRHISWIEHICKVCGRFWQIYRFESFCQKNGTNKSLLSPKTSFSASFCWSLCLLTARSETLWLLTTSSETYSSLFSNWRF